LVQQQLLQTAARLRKCLPKVIEAEIISEWLRRQRFDLRKGRQFLRCQQAHPPKLPHVTEDKPAFIAKIKNNVGIGRQWLLGSNAQKLSRHAQVHQQNIQGVQLEQDVLTTAVNSLNLRTAKFAFEGSSRNAGEETRKVYVQRNYALSEDGSAKPTHDMFDLR
jgi:hypothetical protein